MIKYKIMKERFYRFMAGRYGSDRLNKFLLAVFGVLLVISFFASGAFHTVLILACTVILALSYYRILSRDTYKRSMENQKYLKYKRDLFTRLKNVKERFVQRKDYKFFTCPSCKATLRVPRGRGKIKIVCRRCGHTFLGKS